MMMMVGVVGKGRLKPHSCLFSWNSRWEPWLMTSLHIRCGYSSYFVDTDVLISVIMKHSFVLALLFCVNFWGRKVFYSRCWWVLWYPMLVKPPFRDSVILVVLDGLDGQLWIAVVNAVYMFVWSFECHYKCLVYMHIICICWCKWVLV